jgi:hypothetical protein
VYVRIRAIRMYVRTGTTRITPPVRAPKRLYEWNAQIGKKFRKSLVTPRPFEEWTLRLPQLALCKKRRRYKVTVADACR